MTTDICNKSCFAEERPGIYRLRIPFDTLYTSIFLIVCESGNILFDAASCAEDVDGYLIRALHGMGLSLADIDTLVISHRHGDHAGGLERILSLAPSVRVVSSACRLTPEIEIYPMAGHTVDAVGILDTRTGTLLSGDGLQGAGVGRYRVALEDAEVYRKTIARIRQDERIQSILFSHAYEPWLRDHAHGRDAIRQALEDCETYITNGERNTL